MNDEFMCSNFVSPHGIGCVRPRGPGPSAFPLDLQRPCCYAGFMVGPVQTGRVAPRSAMAADSAERAAKTNSLSLNASLTCRRATSWKLSARSCISNSTQTTEVRRHMPKPTESKRKTIAFKTDDGTFHVGDVLSLLSNKSVNRLRGKIQLIVTSPPFPLNKKKSYGNLNGKEYLDWFVSLAPKLADMLTPDGSIVIEIGNAWERHRPVQSLLPLQALMGFLHHENAGLRLCQEFICYNPSRLPSPAAWVTTKRIRAVDSYTRIWWMAKTDYPKANNARVLRPYSESMKKLIARQKFNSGRRPSHHKISEAGFLKDCGGSIAHNFFEVDALDPARTRRLPNAFSFSNTASNDFFSRVCKKKNIVPHPARMPMGLAAFFVLFLTDRGDYVFDPFAGTNTTGYAAQRLGRKWLAIDASKAYARQAQLRFDDPELTQLCG